MKNVKDNFIVIIAMFSKNNWSRLANKLNKETRFDVAERLKSVDYEDSLF